MEMEIEEIEKLFEKYSDDGEYLEFDRVKNKLSNRPDLHAFMLLDSLFPGTEDIVVAAEHDEFWLSITNEDIESLKKHQICELVRYGVRMEDDSLCLFT